MSLLKVTINNWENIISSEYSMIVIEKNDCSECEKWTKSLLELNVPKNLIVAKLNLNDPGLGRIKIENPWISTIDILPFNTFFVNGKMTENWSGARLGPMDRLFNFSH